MAGKMSPGSNGGYWKNWSWAWLAASGREATGTSRPVPVSRERPLSGRMIYCALQASCYAAFG